LKRKALKKTGLMGKLFGRRQSTSAIDLKLNAQDNALISIISAAREGLKDDLMQLLKQEGKDILRAKTNDDMTPLHLACQEGHYECVNIILKYKPEMNPRDKHGWTPLHCAAVGGHLRIIDLLISANIDTTMVTDDHNTVLHYLAKAEWNENVSYLLIFLILLRR
jgi:ankyrin repeat protein